MARTKQTKKEFRCTACDIEIKTSFDAWLHPLLQCLICRRCHSGYGTGDFSLFNDPETGPGVDELGDDNYCRWCVDGGDLFACGRGEKDDPDRCHYAFCSECIVRNCPDDQVLSAEELPAEEKANFKWHCFACDPDKLKRHRQEAQDVIAALSQRDLKRALPANSSSNSNTSNTTNNVSINNINSVANLADSSDISASASKKRRTESASSSTDKPRDSEKERFKSNGKERNKEKEVLKDNESSKDNERERLKEVGKDRPKDIEKERPKDSEKDRSKESEKDRSKDNGKERSKDNQKDRSKDLKDVSLKEPEASSMPPLAKPKPPVTSLRKLASKSSSIQSSKQPSNEPTSQKQSSSSNSHDNTKVQGPSTPSSNKSALSSSKPPLADLQLKPRQASANEDSSKSQFSSGLPQRPRPLSKQLKPTNEQINPSTKVPLSEIELKKKLEMFGKIKQNCVTEIGSKFDMVLEMFQSKELENKTILKYEIEDLEKPIQEFCTMLRDLKSLYHSQT